MITTTNIVLKGNLGCTIPRELQFGDRRRKFSGRKLKLGNCTVLIYNSGVFLLLGVKSLSYGEHAAFELVEKAQNLGLSPIRGDLQVVNIVAMCDFMKSINLEKFYLQHMSSEIKIFYDPEIMRPLKIDFGYATVLIHHTSKTIIAGAKTYFDVYSAVNALAELL